jgi:peptide-methionine (S)-S-oxide reductase
MAQEKATFGGGCFWCTEAVLEILEGVSDVTSGYEGGQVPNPTYQAVCSGRTGHAEVVQVTFDNDVISFENLFLAFMISHDPTTLNRQGADTGTQYRSVVFYHSPEQEATARRIIADLDSRKLFPRPIVTEVSPTATFYPAEQYHQDYFRNNPHQGYCAAVIEPKLSKFRKMFMEKHS